MRARPLTDAALITALTTANFTVPVA